MPSARPCAPVPFAINGLGRVGRALLRIAHRRDDVRVVAVNDVVPAATLARLLARDTVHGPFPGDVELRGETLRVDGRPLPVSAAPRPGECPWPELPAQRAPRVVVEASGRFLDRTAAAGHLRGPVRCTVVSANSETADVTVCRGINDGDLDPDRHRVVSNASCTTHCAAPLLKVLTEGFGVERAVMTTVHSYTGSQRLLDSAHPDVRRTRAAAANIIPIGTTAPAALGRVMPALAGKVVGSSVRVPTPMGAMMELSVHLAAEATASDLRSAYRRAAAGDLGAVLAVSDDEGVSSDYIGSPYSAVVDLPLTTVVDRRMARVVAWYDNEWGYATRLAELVARLGAE